jgi:WD40 repeat protein
LKLWKVSTGECVRNFVGNNGWIYSADFSNDDNFVISGSDTDKTLKLWNVKFGECIRTLYGHIDVVSSVSFSNDN